jgi:Uma2 family endonuclease
MATAQVRASSWLHDDAEEDLVGASWHQRAIQSTASSISSVAAVRGLPWLVGNQLTLIASEPDGTAWRPSPDIMVYTSGGPAEREAMVVATDGLPALIIEVLSPSTWDYDVNVQEGKAWGYLQLGVPFYLVFDPHADLQGRPCRGWRRDEGELRAWLPEADGRYRVPALGLSFKAEESLLRVYDPDGKPVPFDIEMSLRQHAMEEIMQAQRELLHETEQREARLLEAHQQLLDRLVALEAEVARLKGQA